jgi:hypothetical protein
MVRGLVLGVILALALADRAISAEGVLNGNELVTWCQGQEWDGKCRGYVSAIADTIERSRYRAGASPCVPATVSSSQVRVVVLQYLLNHPAMLSAAASELATNAIAEVWCPSGKPNSTPQALGSAPRAEPERILTCSQWLRARSQLDQGATTFEMGNFTARMGPARAKAFAESIDLACERWPFLMLIVAIRIISGTAPMPPH